ncbi:MAG: hypothetical protein P1U56_15175 [Saprospiraceae bacterium]|nr:hypothetical protein [Saprospiraceae bacterium]
MRILKFVYVLFFAILLVSCEKESTELIENDDQVFEATTRENTELENYLGYNVKNFENGNFTFYINDKDVITGTKTGENHYLLSNPNGELLEMKADMRVEGGLNEQISARKVGDPQYSEIFNFSYFFAAAPNATAQAANPCNQHPAGESFDNCFKREWSDFCEDFISCIAQITNPIPVAVAVGIHCASC